MAFNIDDITHLPLMPWPRINAVWSKVAAHNDTYLAQANAMDCTFPQLDLSADCRSLATWDPPGAPYNLGDGILPDEKARRADCHLFSMPAEGMCYEIFGAAFDWLHEAEIFDLIEFEDPQPDTIYKDQGRYFIEVARWKFIGMYSILLVAMLRNCFNLDNRGRPVSA